MENCKVMNFGKYMIDFYRNEQNIEKTGLERDLDVIVANYCKWSGHVDRIVGKANRILNMLKRTFESREPRLWKDLYVSLVRPHLEHAVEAWNPYL